MSIPTRVAWIRPVDDPDEKKSKKFKVGMEFIGLNSTVKRAISRFLKSIA